MKKLILILNLIFLISCSNVNKKDFFPIQKIVNNGFEFQEGDILILNKLPNIYSIFGHSAIVLGNGTVAEYPMYGYGYMEVGLADWLNSSLERQITVLRVPLNEEQKTKLKLIIASYSQGKYGIFNRKLRSNEFYCSSFIWRIYYDLGINLDENFLFFVLPYDFLKYKNIARVKLEES